MTRTFYTDRSFELTAAIDQEVCDTTAALEIFR